MKSTPDAAPAPKNTRTLKALVGAAQRLMSDGRMDAATLDDIAREAEVSKRSFHNHFIDKDALVSHVLTVVRADLEAQIATVNADVNDPAVDLTRGMLVSFRYGMENRLGQQVMLHIARGVADPAAERNLALADSLRKGITSGAFRLPGLDAGIVLVLALSDLGLSRLLQLRDERQRARELMHDICLLLLRGLGVDARRHQRIVEDALRAVVDGPAADGRR